MEQNEPRPTNQEPGRPYPVDNPARYGAPLPPPPAAAAAPSAETPDWAAPSSSARRARPRLLAAGLALAVVAVAGGAGFALGRHGEHGAVTAGGPAGGYSQKAPNSGGFGGSPFGETDPFAGTPFAGPGSPGGSPFDSASGGTPASSSQLSGLVRIASTLKYAGSKAAGTGMILTSTGEVITNHHVAAGSTKLRVTVMSTGKTYTANVVGTDAKDDVAVLQLEGASPPSPLTRAGCPSETRSPPSATRVAAPPSPRPRAGCCRRARTSPPRATAARPASGSTA